MGLGKHLKVIRERYTVEEPSQDKHAADETEHPATESKECKYYTSDSALFEEHMMNIHPVLNCDKCDSEYRMQEDI